MSESAPARSGGDGSTMLRTLLVIFVIDSLGTGAFTSVQIIYFTAVLHLTSTGVSVGLSVAGFAGLLFVLPLGRVADRRSPFVTLLILHLVLAVAFGLYLLPLTPVTFALTSCVVLTTQRVISPIRRALISQTFREKRVRVSASCRVASNIGFSLGALVAAGVAVSAGDEALMFLVIADSVSFVVCGILALRLRVPIERSPASTRRFGFVVLRDRRYVLSTALNFVGSFHETALFVALPLWVLQRTNAPAVIVPVVSIVNGLLVVALQTLAARNSDNVRGALRAQAVGAALFAAGCAAVALSSGGGRSVSVVLVLLGCLGFTGAEIWQSSGAWGLSYALAPPEHMAQYQSLFGIGTAAQETVGPAAMSALVLGLVGGTGWLVAGLVVLLIIPAGRMLNSPKRDRLPAEAEH
jgi:Major Facilitator Superfamily